MDTMHAPLLFREEGIQNVCHKHFAVFTLPWICSSGRHMFLHCQLTNFRACFVTEGGKDGLFRRKKEVTSSKIKTGYFFYRIVVLGNICSILCLERNYYHLYTSTRTYELPSMQFNNPRKLYTREREREREAVTKERENYVTLSTISYNYRLITLLTLESSFSRLYPCSSYRATINSK